MRSTPFDQVFGTLARERFPRLRDSLIASHADPHDLDAFILDREVVGLLRDLVPEGAGESLDQHLSLLHHAYLFWIEGGWSFRLSRARAEEILKQESSSSSEGTPVPRAYYIQFPERLVWAELEPGAPHEPLDGLFVRPWPGGGYFVLAVFGMHPKREGFTVVEADGFPVENPAREDGSPLFSPVMAGGTSAQLASLVGQEELLELASRTCDVVGEAVRRIGPEHRPHASLEIN
ncbi:MAG TPA: hypothetical protein VLB12_12280 [Gemmatimonadales bacterium]|nr:hypothetical protein [Gemmatimonadales bacterium]